MFATAKKRTSVNDLGRFGSNLDRFHRKFRASLRCWNVRDSQKTHFSQRFGSFWIEFGSSLSKFWGQFKVLKCSRQPKNAFQSTIWVVLDRILMDFYRNFGSGLRCWNVRDSQKSHFGQRFGSFWVESCEKRGKAPLRGISAGPLLGLQTRRGIY